MLYVMMTKNATRCSLRHIITSWYVILHQDTSFLYVMWLFYFPATEAYFVEMLEDVSVNEGMPATFSCRVFPKTAPVTWLVDGEEISSNDPKYQMMSKDDERTLEIVRSLRGDSGKYTVFVGELQSYATLTVEGSNLVISKSRLFCNNCFHRKIIF